MLRLQDTQCPANTGAAQRKERDRKNKLNNMRVVKSKVRGDEKVDK